MKRALGLHEAAVGELVERVLHELDRETELRSDGRRVPAPLWLPVQADEDLELLHGSDVLPQEALHVLR
jgi:hypothetical protein